jgi:hypothetical protein
MIEGLALILAEYLGPKAVAFLEARRKQRDVQAARSRQARESQLAPSTTLVALIADYYGQTDASHLRRYDLVSDGQTLGTSMFLPAEAFRMCLPASSLTTYFEEDAQLPASPPDAVVSEFAAKVADHLEALGVRLWNDPLYCLRRIDLDGPSFGFAEVPFMRWRFTSGLLPDEASDALLESDGDPNAVLRDQQIRLPIRNAIAPTRGSLWRVADRLCCGGFGLTVAIARNDPAKDYVIPLQRRSSQVSDNRGLMSVLPKGFHQAAVAPDREVSPYWSAMREVFEEIFEGEEEVGRRDVRRLRHDWYFTAHDAMAWLQQNPDSYRLEVISFGINGIGGNYEYAMLLEIHDTEYWDRFGPQIRGGWESESTLALSTLDTSRIRRLLSVDRWAPEGVFQVGEALIRLRERSPERTALPTLEVSWG